MTKTARSGGFLANALATGVTYRQLVYWKERGYIAPEFPSRGSGARDVWNTEDTARLRTLAAYVAMVGQPDGDVIRMLWTHLAPRPFHPRWLFLHKGGIVETEHGDQVPTDLGNVIRLYHEGRP